MTFNILVVSISLSATQNKFKAMRLLKFLFLTITFSMLWSHSNAQCFVSQTHVDNGNGNFTFQGQASSNMPSMGTFYWNFGDGGTGFGQTITHTYTQSGWYSPCVTYYDSLGCQATNCDSIYVQLSTPCTNFNAGYQYSVGTNGTVSLFGFVNNSTSGGTVQYVWNLGNGVTTTGQNITQVLQPGSYLICLTATDTLYGCTSTFCDTVVVANSNPCANFSVQVQHNLLTGGAVAFNAALAGGTPGTIVEFQWDFGDGNTAYGPNPTHQYNQTGSYVVCVSALDSLNGCFATDCDTIYVQVPNPCSGFNAGYQYSVGTNGTVSLFGFVNNGTTGTGIQYAWNLGIGTILYGQNVSQVLQPGSYVICLTATDSLNGCTSTYCDTVIVGNSNPCNLTVLANSVIDTNGGTTTGTLVYFSATTTGGTQPMNFVWDFGDGATAVGQNPGHVYTQPNTGYLACVTVTDANGCTATDCDSVFTGNNTNPCANFTGGFQYTVSSTGVVQLYGSATSSGTNNMVHYQWNIGNINTLYGQQVSITLQPGTYQICMTAMDSLYGCSFTTCQTVTVNQTGTICSQYSTGFQWFDQGNATVNFTGYASLGSLTTQSLYVWDFGNGATAVGQNVSHSYNAPGTYYVCLTSYDSVTNCTATFCDTVTVTIGNPCGNLTASYTFVSNGGGAVQFNASSNSNSNVIYTWDFGDGQTGTGQNVLHLFYPNFSTVIGYYYVCVTAFEPATGCTATYCGYLIIINLPFPPNVPGPPITISTGNGGIIIFKDDQSSDIQHPINGDLETSEVASYVEQIELANPYGVVNVYPNPVSDVLNVDVMSMIDEDVEIQINDITNKHIKSSRQTLNKGENILRITTDELQSGVYLVKVIGHDQIRTMKFIKN